ncbi:hypothetical protein L5515_003309 [Caenorhabditis briggsae]|uniref:Uncharacterized protein n=1 Tax=Caenorhabditis briggsae TaxID=6238 RepID=A0AAE9EI43_CAEBR|nr:hypothetical protein L5515_003309 [Caenorhabditis briggsae]
MPEPECLALVLSDQEIEERNRSQQVQQPVQLHLVQPPIRAPVRSVSPPPVQPAVLQMEYNSARSRSRSPRVDDHAQLPRENGQEEEMIRELTPLQ